VMVAREGAQPPSWCAVMMISRMPIAAEAAIQSSASRSVGLKTSGLRQGCARWRGAQRS
jgi:hypothetical protein